MRVNVRTARAVVALATLALVGCTSHSRPAATSGTPTNGSPTTATSAASSTATSTATSGSPTASASGDVTVLTTQVEAVGLQKSDLHTGQTRELIDGGDKVDGEVTLDNCGFDFTSEKFRLVRRQYQVTDDASGNGVISTEVVGYDTAAHARLALDEWFTSASTCPKTPVDSGVQGVPPLTYTVIDNRRDVAMVPVKPNVVTSEAASAGSQGTERLMAFMQQRGQVLAIVYLDTSKPFTLAERSQAVALAGLVGKRLASQP